MKIIRDKYLEGYAMIFDGPLDLAEAAKAANRGPAPFKQFERVNWPGRRGATWEDGIRFLHTPWPEAVDRVRMVADGIRKAPELPRPRSIKRVGRFSADDGDVDVDRAMHGEPEFYRRVVRSRAPSTPHVALITNLESTTSGFTNPSGVFYRSSLCIALADVLEELGFSVEIWAWTRGLNVYPDPFGEEFLAVKIKPAGEMVDYDALCDTLSDWYTTQVLVGAIAINPHAKPLGKGMGVEVPEDTPLYLPDGTVDWDTYGIQEWVSYLDLEEGIQVHPVPMVRGFWGGGNSGIGNAIKAAGEVLRRIAGQGVTMSKRGKRWYVLAVDSGTDRKVRKELKKLAKREGMEKWIARVIIPRHAETRLREGKEVRMNCMLYPGYLIVHLRFNAEVFYALESMKEHGAYGLLPKPTEPIPLTSKEEAMCFLRDKVVKVRKKLVYYGTARRSRFKAGDKVKVKAGSWLGFEGEVQRTEGATVFVAVNLMGRVVSAPIPDGELDHVTP